MMKIYKVFSYIIIGAVITTLLLLATCNNIICSNAEGRLYTDIGSIPPSEVGLLLGTTPQTRIGHKPNQFSNTELTQQSPCIKQERSS